MGRHGQPLFSMIPRSFTLAINNVKFVSVSYDFLFAERLGFPFPRSRFVRSGGGEVADMAQGTGISRFPLLDFDFPKGSRQIWQPMMPWRNGAGDEEAEHIMRSLYDVPYVRSCCSDFERGRGRVYIGTRHAMAPYPDHASAQWVPYRSVDRDTATYGTALISSSILERLMLNHADLSHLPEDERESIEQQIEGAISLHQAMLATFRKGWELSRKTSQWA